ncbi:hypothetical protein [Fictibacillus gelatini]|uniref:hypothetical protein n=1 Tax=Fictibacillus gelatini TaxID=225985 RepID=UPI0003FDD3F7|nr:hypothetical protein [Fictibacillus gelatini]
MNYYATKANRFGELLFIVKDILAGKRDYNDFIAELDELSEIGNDFKSRQDDAELKLLGVNVVKFLKQFRRSLRDGKPTQKQTRRLLRLISAIVKLISAIERRDINGV